MGLLHGPSRYVRFDRGAELTAEAAGEWLQGLDMATPFVEPTIRCRNSYNESSNRKPRDELLNSELLYTMQEAQILIEQCRAGRWDTDRRHLRASIACHAATAHATMSLDSHFPGGVDLRSKSAVASERPIPIPSVRSERRELL